MWCPKCQADVAAEVTADHRRVLCANCSAEIGGVHSSTLALEKTREARELLERWSNSRFTDPYGPVIANKPNATATDNATAERVDTAPAPSPSTTTAPTEMRTHISGGGPHYRIRPSVDQSQPTQVTPLESAAGTMLEKQPHSFQQETKRTGKSLRHDAGHATGAPHFDVHAAIADKRIPRTNWSALIGQLLAYGGVAALTVGTVLVLWGYFGKLESYVPTGWLILTAGQMLFFLGGVTLISGGVEQATEEVSRRIDSLGERMLRFERSSQDHALRGPSIPAERFANAECRARNAE
ncbi:MAG: hypothetical protein WD648_06105 [Planctomycetaceae bacterium]